MSSPSKKNKGNPVERHTNAILAYYEKHMAKCEAMLNDLKQKIASSQEANRSPPPKPQHEPVNVLEHDHSYSSPSLAVPTEEPLGAYMSAAKKLKQTLGDSNPTQPVLCVAGDESVRVDVCDTSSSSSSSDSDIWDTSSSSSGEFSGFECDTCLSPSASDHAGSW